MSVENQWSNKENERYALRQKLNKLGEQWNPFSPDEAVQKKIKNDIWLIAYQIWNPYNISKKDRENSSQLVQTKMKRGKQLTTWEAEAQMDAFIDTMKEVLKKFDPARSTLTAYIELIWKKKLIDRKRTLGLPGKYITDQQNPEQKIWRANISVSSLDEPFQGPDGENRSRGELICDEIDQYSEREEQLDAIQSILTIMSHVLKMIEQRNQDKRSKYIYEPLFFTRDVVNYCQLEKRPIIFQHESELWDVIEEKFVDFCLEDICRSLFQIQQSEMKTYRQIGRADKSNADDRISIPMPNTIGIEYLRQVENKSVSAAAYGEQSKKYRESVLHLLKQNDLISDEV